MPGLRLNLPGQLLSRLARWFKLESGSSIVTGLTQLVRLQVEAAQQQVGIGRGLQFQGLMSLHACAGGVPCSFPHLRQTYMSFCAVYVFGHCRLIQPLSFQQQSAVEKGFGLDGKLLCPLKRLE